MGGMGMGGMGGMGGGMGMMGGGMRSVPPSGLPQAILQPNQTRTLPTSLVSISSEPGSGLKFPEKGERLEISDAVSLGMKPEIRNALIRMAYLKTPQIVSQMVMWNLAEGLSWERIANRVRGRATQADFALAKDLATRLAGQDALKEFEVGRVFWDLTDKAPAADLLENLEKWFEGKEMLGLGLEHGIPETQIRPSVALRIHVQSQNEATVEVLSTEGLNQGWVNQGKFHLNLARDNHETEDQYIARVTDGLSSGLLDRLVRVQESSRTIDGRKMYQLKIDNAAPLVLAGLAVKSPVKGKEIATIMNLSIRPHQGLRLPLDPKSVSKYGLNVRGLQATAADFTAL